MTTPSTKQKLLSLVEDVEIVSKELFDLLATPRQHRPEGIELGQVVELLKMKDEEIQDSLKVAAEQAELQQKMDQLKSEVEKRDHDIKVLQKNLKEAESSLSTAIYQAKQKLTSINQANQKMISSEELIKYAHRISSSNAVSAPPTWVPGDTRRPYPTDIEMRMGMLGRIGEGTPGVILSQSVPPESLAPGRHPNMEQLLASNPAPHVSTAMQTTWHAPGSTATEQSMVAGQHGAMAAHSHAADRHHPKDEDVEIMSSDSSSSSSSDD